MPGTQRGVTLRFLAEPMDANVRGVMSAGKVLEWIDKAGYAAAVGWAGTYAVTGYVGNIHFTRPIDVGDLVVVQARVVLTGRTSLQVVCTVSSGDPRSSDRVLNTQCVLQFVAMEDGRPVPVPAFEPRDDWERGQHARALEINQARRAIEEEMGRQEYDTETQSCRETLRFLSAPTDVNWGGKVHGGYVMNWIDQAAQVVAERWHAGPVASVFAGGVRFYRPMFIGDLVEVDARLLHTGTTSMHLAVDVYSRHPTDPARHKTTHCIIIFVAMDEHGKPSPVPQWQPVSEQDLSLQQYARKLMALREELDKEMRQHM